MKTIVLQFSANNGVASRLIRWFTWSPYSHVDFVLDNGKLLGAQTNGGVLVRAPDSYSKVLRVAVEAPDAVLEYAQSQIGKPYDYSGIFGIILRSNWHRSKNWFCSELVAWSFQQAKHPLLRTENTSRITPRDLLLSPLLVRSSEGENDA